MEVVGSGNDMSKEPAFTEAVAHKVYYGPVYFRRESEPYMTLSLAGTRRDTGVSIAQVNLKLIWDVLSKIKFAGHGRAYVVDADGRLIAHPDISLVLRNTDMSQLAQVRGARAAAPAVPPSKCRKPSISTATRCSPPRPRSARSAGTSSWKRRSKKPTHRLYAAIERTALVLLGALALAFAAGLFLARTHGGADPERCARVRHVSAPATSANASQSRPATKLRRWPISSTIWLDGCRSPTPTSSKKSTAHS